MLDISRLEAIANKIEKNVGKQAINEIIEMYGDGEIIEEHELSQDRRQLPLWS